jgi:hypothetical protein
MLVRVFVPLALAVSIAVPSTQSQKAIIVTVVDQSGAAVKDVVAADLAVVEDGATREVVEVTPATDPMTIALIVDTTKPAMGRNAPTQELRAGLGSFVKVVHAASPQSLIGVWEFGGAGVMTLKPTAKTEDVIKKVTRVFPGQQPAGVMLEALVDASKELNKKGVGPRRIVVGISFDSPEASTVEPRQVALEMRKAGVNFWAISIGGAGSASAGRDLILDNVTTASGGLRLTAVTGTSIESQLKSIAEALTSQYIVTYARPAGAPSTVTDIRAVSKKGMKALTAPWVQ